jgi:lysophospholipase L1-like esterase
VAALFSYFTAAHGTGGEATSPAGYVVFDGDSTVYGVTCTRGNSWPVQIAPANGWRAANVSFPGNTVVGAIASAYPDRYASSTARLFVNMGVNDLNGGASAATTWANLATYISDRITAGYLPANIFINTLTCANPLGGERDAYSGLIRTNAPGLGVNVNDNASDPVVGVALGASAINTPSLMNDGTHWNDSGAIAKAAFDRSVSGTQPF